MKKLMFVLVTAALLLLHFPFLNAALDSGEAYAQECTELTSNMVITEDTTLRYCQMLWIGSHSAYPWIPHR